MKTKYNKYIFATLLKKKQLRPHKLYSIILGLVVLMSLFSLDANAQRRVKKPINQPFADQKIYHFGFFLGMHTQNLSTLHTGYVNNGEVWFSEIPSYSPGFTVGLIADRYLSQYFNLRATPALHFGEKKFTFKEQTSGEEFTKSIKSTYIELPLVVKFNAARIQNARPYFTAGAYASYDMNRKKDQPVRFKAMDYGLEFGLGCNIYLPLFKLCPEIKFSLGLANVIDKKTNDVTDKEMLKYRNSLKSGKTRMISLIFNFE